MSGEAALLRAVRLSRTFGSGRDRVQALAPLDLEVRQGEFIAISGQSGAGKSTLLQLLGALDRGYEGSLCIQGRELRDLGDRALSRLRNQKIGFVFQAFNLLPGLTVGDNILMPAHFGATDSRAAEARARELLGLVGLDGFWSKLPLTLSGGERQRVAIARALLLDPPLLLCDEPTGSLDADNAAAVMALFTGLAAERGTTLVVVTHDSTVAVRADRVVHLRRGTAAGAAPVPAAIATSEAF